MQLSDEPLEGSLVRLVLVSPDEVKILAAGERLEWFAEGYPREDDQDAMTLVSRTLEADRRWSVRHIIRRSDGLAVGTIGFFSGRLRTTARPRSATGWSRRPAAWA
ncbi:hypothetical protein [Fodinicola feengrottensis]|uniref:hypothetical protein n=1 Tax=Fodinicola feengrottensis TaxID=435914 RepID=UPI002442D4C3|nr:hypothetical protein [Fodinicola feengrottensis]